MFPYANLATPAEVRSRRDPRVALRRRGDARPVTTLAGGLPLRAAVMRVLGIGAVALLGAALVHGTPSAAELRRSACALAGCATPTPIADASRTARLASGGTMAKLRRE